ncbi:MAG: hypothetical protein ND895_21830 [Pyrinomonadaceae bacterium]|nr:hypothetical protein [Pyrinomonadaceae bacterium]
MGSFRYTTGKLAALICGSGKKATTPTPSPTPSPPPTPGPVIPFQRYLNRAYKLAKDAHELGPTDLGLRASIPISIFLRSKGPDHEYAGVLDEIAGVGHHLDLEEHFSASLMKVAAMFAAYKLRKEAQLLIKDIQDHKETATTPANFFTKLNPRLHLDKMAKRIKTEPAFIQGKVRKEPSFAEILAVTGSFGAPATLDVNFTADFRSHMRKMIIPSDNCSAGECISRLSYPYINVALMQDGFFNEATMKGIWLCGDFILPKCPNVSKIQPFIRIETVNDCDQVGTLGCGSAQNTTSKEMARLFLNILTEQLVDPDSSREIRALLHEGQFGSPPGTAPPVFPPRVPPMRGGGASPDPSFLTRNLDDITIDLLFDVDGVKIGQGPLKPDPARTFEVRSEGLLIKWKKIDPLKPDFDATLKKKFDDLNLTGEAAVCYQNFSGAGGQLHDGIAKIIHSSVLDFINRVPLP